ncbi:MAG: hypothetical protein KF740_19920 [Ramlibacter sp.]|nr:hypothetical protein [Ramlibacter sp.]
MTDAIKPVKLQVNTSGAWKDVVTFDAADDAVGDQVIEGAAQIGRATAFRFRVVMTGPFSEVLMHFDPVAGWKAVAA